MRLHRLWLKEFKNLRDLTLEFSPSDAVSVLVGHNGTGKSNAIEALTIIFRDLDLGEQPAFSYSIKYESRGDIVTIEADPSARAKVRALVNGRRVSQAKLRGEEGVRHLPDFVFGYYSGPSNRLQQHFERHQEGFNRALREGSSRPLRRLFYAQPTHSQFVLLAFYLNPNAEELDFLRQYLRIAEFESAMFVLREPPWRSRQGDPRFWMARGVVADLLSQLYEIALAPFRRVDSSPGGSGPREHLYLYLKDLNAIRELAHRYGDNPRELFKAFESILAADLLSEVRVRVRAPGMDESLVFRELSEGEQQLLMVLGLLRFTRESESLFLLDEPDTHLNPAWSVSYTSMLEENAGDPSATSQLVMATHDPLVISGLLREQVILLERDDATGWVSATRPDKSPRGMGVAGLLTSDIYDLASELDPETLEKLERRRWLAAAEEQELTPSEKEELGRLTAELEALDFTFTTRDPLYVTFERAMASLERTRRPVLSRKEGEAEREESRRVLEELLESNPQPPGE